MYYGHHLGVYSQHISGMIIILLECYRIKLSILETLGHILDTYDQYYSCIMVVN